ncbi:hypothetical protein TWF481_000831 [Arthrobotrys musiformis]|uniref:Uncharacterized protein n=1 Tax=Arthrobotrys musiformis TaxID=47236 RepID=A0AAV9WNQ9_9PEZI
MGCPCSKEDDQPPGESSQTANPNYGMGRTLGSKSGGNEVQGAGPRAAAADAAARRHDAKLAAESRAKTKLKPQPNPEPASGGKVTNSDTLAWN